MFSSFLNAILGQSHSNRSKNQSRRSSTRPGFRPRLEALEDRMVPSVVTSSADSGANTLRQAIINAVDDETITFSGVQTINLSSQITTGKDLIIDGGNGVTINAGSNSRIFEFDSVLSETLTHLTLTGGNGGAGGLNGGAIRITGGLSLNDVTFSSNTTGGGGVGNNYDGGAIYITEDPTYGGTLTATNTRFTSNTATGNGGAIAAFSLFGVTLTNCSFTSNTAANNGGAIYTDFLATDTLTATDCVFTTNTSTNGDGGGIFTKNNLAVSYSSIVSRFSGNRAGGNGGAIAWEPTDGSPSTFSVTTTTFNSNNNAGRDGGAIYCLSTVQDGETNSVSVDRSLITGNSAAHGGGMFVENDTRDSGIASVTMTNSTFYSNTSSSDGGAIAILTSNQDAGRARNTVALTSLTVYQNTALNGGGIYTNTPDNGKPVVDNCIIAGNTAFFPGWDVYGNVDPNSRYNLLGTKNGRQASRAAPTELAVRASTLAASAIGAVPRKPSSLCPAVWR